MKLSKFNTLIRNIAKNTTNSEITFHFKESTSEVDYIKINLSGADTEYLLTVSKILDRNNIFADFEDDTLVWSEPRKEEIEEEE